MSQNDSLEEQFKKEVLKVVDNKVSKKELDRLMQEANISLNFFEKINEVEIPDKDYVIFTDGQEQLFYENGEFYVISAVDANKKKKKKTLNEARDMYLDFFIKYELNPFLEGKSKDDTPQKEVSQRVKKPKVKSTPQKQEKQTVAPQIKVAAQETAKEEKVEIKDVPQHEEKDEPML